MNITKYWPSRFFLLTKNLWHIFVHTPGAKPIGITVGMVIVGFFDFFSIGAILPLVSTVSHMGGKQNSKLGLIFDKLFNLFGVSPSFTAALFLVLFLMAAKILASFFAVNYIAKTVSKIAVLLRIELLNSLFSAQWMFFINHHPGYISSTVSADAETSANAYSAAATVIAEIMKIIVATSLALFLSPVLFITLIPAIILIFIPIGFIIKATRNARRKKWDKTANLISYVQDVVSIMKPLKSMNRQKMHSKIFSKNITYLYNSSVKSKINKNILGTTQESLIVLSICGILYIGKEIYNLGFAELIIFGFLFFVIANSTRQLQSAVHDFASTQSAYWNIRSIITEANGMAEVDNGTLDGAMLQGCSFRNVSFGYDSHLIFKDTSVEFLLGSINVLTGPSGIGKTTLIDLLVGFHKPDMGEILVDKKPLTSISLQSWRDQIGYVPQELILVEGTIFDNITLSDPALTELDVEMALARAGAGDFVKSLENGIYTKVGHLGLKFSGGQRQRISLARALVRSPKVLILDEVTSSLDEKSEKEIIDNIKLLSQGMLIISVTHRNAWLEAADHIFTIENMKVKMTL